MNFKGIVCFVFLCFALLNAQEKRGFLSSEEIALFYEQGYVLKRQCFSPGEMDDLNAKVTAVIDRSLKAIENSEELTFSEDDQILYIGGSRIVCKKRSDKSISIARINGCTGIEPALLATLRSEKMVRTFFELLGTTDLEHVISQMHPKLPGDGIAYLRHRDIQFRKSFDPDWQDILGNGSYAICIIPIEAMTPENGGLWIDKNNYPEEQGLEEDREWLYAEPGDLLFMHPHLYHGSGVNTSVTNSRKTLLTGFCAFGANHRAYPGAHVNTRLKLTETDSIEITICPWSNDAIIGPGTGH